MPPQCIACRPVTPHRMRNNEQLEYAQFAMGQVYDVDKHRFGTTAMSPLYRCITTEKGTEVPLKSDLVAGAGLEPATSWL